MILDNLRKAGVQNTQGASGSRSTGSTRTRASGSRPTGEYTENGAAQDASRSRIGPEYGTVGPELVKDAAKEAVQGSASTCSSSAASPSTRTSGEEASSARQADGPAGPDEPRPRDGRRAAQEDRRRQPVHGLRRARHRRPTPSADGKLVVEITRRRRLRPDDRRDPRSARPTTSPAGSSTPTTTARASSSATPTSPAPTTPTTSSSAPSGPRSTRPPGRRSTRTVSRPFAAPDDRQDRRQGHQPLRRRGAEGLRRRIGGGRMTDEGSLVRGPDLFHPNSSSDPTARATEVDRDVPVPTVFVALTATGRPISPP